MKRLLFFIMMFFTSLSIVSGIDYAKVTLFVDEQNHIKKQYIIENKEEELTIKMSASGKIPGNIYGYHINMKDINSNINYNLDKDVMYLKDLKKQGRIVVNTEYDISYKQNDGYEYFVLMEGVNKKIKTLNVQVKFEKDYLVKGLKVYVNGKEIDRYINYVDDNTISMKITNLKENDEIAFRVKRNVKSSFSVLTIVSFVFPTLCLILSFALWQFYGKDNRDKIDKRMNPVRQLSLLEVARLYNEKVVRADVISLIFSLCSKGYMEIKETEDDLKFVRVKNYSGHSYSEGLLFDAIFLKSYVGTFDEAINKKKKDYNSEISVKDVRVIRTIDRILANENMNEKKYEYYERDTTSKKNIIIGMAVTSLVLVTINPFIAINNSLFFILALVIEMLSFYIINKFIGFIDLNRIRKYVIPVLLTIALLVLIFAFIFGTNSIYEIAYLLGVVCVIGMMILAKYMPKRNSFGDKLFHSMEGFKKLLEEGTKEEYQGILNTNENYYYNILSYLYVFGNKEYVCKRFKGLVKKECDWFKSYKKFDYNSFNKTCDVIFEVLRENN